MRTAKKRRSLWVLAALLVLAGGAWAVLFQTDLMPDQRATVSKFVKKLLATGRKGLIRGIVLGQDGNTALIDDQAVREGDSIYGATVVKIYADEVEFEKNGTRWTQGLNEIPGPQWRTQDRRPKTEDRNPTPALSLPGDLRGGRVAGTDSNSLISDFGPPASDEQAEAEAGAQEEAETMAKERAEAETQAQARATEQAEATAKVEEQAKAQEEAETRAKEQPEAPSTRSAPADGLATSRAPARDLALAQGEAKAKDQAEATATAEPPETDDVPQEKAAVSPEQPFGGELRAEPRPDEETQKRVIALISRLGDREPSVRNSVVTALGQIGPPAVGPLIVAMGAEDWIVRQGASQALGKIGDAQAVEPLTAALADKNQWIRRYAAEALGLIGDERAIEPLVAALKDDSPAVRAVAAKALDSIRGPAASQDASSGSQGKRAGTIIGKLLDLKIYIGAAIAGVLLLGVLAMVLRRGQKSI